MKPQSNHKSSPPRAKTVHRLGRDVLSGRILDVGTFAGRVTSIRPCRTAEPNLPWLAPGLVDLQVNGYSGVDFQADGLSVEDLEKAAEGLRRGGCDRFLLTLITAPWRQLLARLRHLKNLRDSRPGLREAIAGWHIEGPFLSAEPGFHGAHDPSLMQDPTPDAMVDLRGVLGSDPILVTLAPERPGAAATIRSAVQRGIRVSLGHTNASASVLKAAVRAGAQGFTHLGNGCPQLWDRHDNILWRVLNQPGLRIGLIPDAIHVSPDLFRLVHQCGNARTFWYVSDAMSAAGMPPGRYPLAGMELEVGADQVVRKPGSPLLAGSALRPMDGVRRAARMLGENWRECYRRFSDQPAEWMGLERGIRIGGRSPRLIPAGRRDCPHRK